MGLGARLIAYNYVGNMVAPFTIDLRAQNFKGSGGFSSVTNVMALTEDANDAKTPWVLSFREVYPDTENQDTQWSDGASNTYRREIPAAFGGDENGIRHERSASGTSYQYTSSFTDGANEPFALRGFTYKAPKELVTPILSFGRGDWLIRIVDGSPEIALKKAGWTQSLQDDLDDLLQLDGHDPQIDEMRADLYEVYQSLSGSIEDGEPFELLVIPEPRGCLNVWIGKEHTRVDVPRIIEDGGDLFGSGAYTVRGNGLAFMWQYGYPLFASEGTVKRRFQFLGTLAAETFTTQADETLSGVNVTGAVLNTPPSTLYDVELTLETSDSRHTPFVYGSQVTFPGGDYNADSSSPGTAYYDTDDFDSPIEDVMVSMDGELLEKKFDIRLRDINGTGFSLAPLSVLTSSWHYQALENRRADLYINGGKMLTLGLVTQSGRMSMKAATPDQPLDDVVGAKTKVTPALCDGWALLDEDIMPESPILDGLRLGAALRLILTNGGFSTADVAGISSSGGPLIGAARLGEEPALRPREGQTRGDLIRELIERRGLGLIFFQDYNGVWQLQNAPTSLVQCGGEDAEFVRNSVRANGAATYPARFAVLEEFDMTFDTSNFYNVFRVEGATKPDGTLLAAQWRIEESISNSSDIIKPSKLYIGRVKRYPTVRDESLRTEAEVQYCLRSLVERFGRVPRFGAFKTYFHQTFYPGALISMDGVTVRIARLSGSIADDRMDLAYQELV